MTMMFMMTMMIMMMIGSTCKKSVKMMEMMRTKVEEVRRGMIPLANIVKWHLQCYHCYDSCEREEDKDDIL